MKLDAIRKFALSLPDTTEEPHHAYASFRVRGKIFATAPPDGEHVHVFVDEPTRDNALAINPEFLEKLLWGGKVVGLRVHLRAARPRTVFALLQRAYEHKVLRAPASHATRPRGKSPVARAVRKGETL
jgi:hypothetical protein